MVNRRKEGAKTIGIIVSVLVILVLVAALVALFRGAHTGG